MHLPSFSAEVSLYKTKSQYRTGTAGVSRIQTSLAATDVVTVAQSSKSCGAMAIEASTQASIGETAPDFALPDLDGNTVSLADFRGEPTLLLFWNPNCGFCQSMLSELRDWEAAPPTNVSRLVVLALGSADANREMELRSPVLLEPDFRVAASFGVTGTPSAVLVDAHGRIASELAIGVPQVRTLLRRGARTSVPRLTV
jgi:peroxiredoxin